METKINLELPENSSQTLLRKGNKVIISRGKTVVSFTQGKGGHIDSCIINGVEILYPFFWDEAKPKGGMPYMFPNAGPLTDTEKQISGFLLEQHGFGRRSHWELEEPSGDQILRFSASESFPFSGEVRLRIKIWEKGEVRFIQKIKNTGKNALPLSTGLHPYFRIPKGNKDEIIWNFVGAEEVVSEKETWKNGGTGKYEMPSNGQIQVMIPEIGTLQLDSSSRYKKFWVWSMKDMDFVCIEPTMGDEGAIVHNPFLLQAWQEREDFLEISLKK